MHGTWLWDDDLYITGNIDLRSLSGLARIWFAPAGVNYFPVTSTVPAMDPMATLGPGRIATAAIIPQISVCTSWFSFCSGG